jgi:hypothetical protein
MTALSAGASLTRYHSRYPAFDGAKLLLFYDMAKFLTQPQNAYKSAICNRKRRFSNCIPNRKRENQIGVQKIQIKKGVRFGFIPKTKSSTPKTKSKKIIHSIERI